MSLNEKLTFFHLWEEKLWDKNIEANHYFSTLSILFVALLGAIVGGGNVLELVFGEMRIPSLPAVLGVVIFIWNGNVAESIVAATNVKVAILRSLLLFGIMVAAFIIGGVLAIFVMIAVVVILALFLVSGALRASAGGGRRRSRRSNDEDDGGIDTKYDGHQTGTFAGDSFHASNGGTYEKTGWGGNDWERTN